MHYCSIGTSRTIDFYPGGPRVDAMSRVGVRSDLLIVLHNVLDNQCERLSA